MSERDLLSHQRLRGPWYGARAAWLWAAGAAAWSVAAVIASLPILGWLDVAWRPPMLAVAWGCLSLVSVLLVGRVSFGRWLTVNWWAMVLGLFGVALAALLQAALRGWAVERFGAYDPEFLGLTAGLFVLVLVSAMGGFGALVAPRGASLPPALAAAGATLVSGVVVATNLPGAEDGLAPGSLLAAILVTASGAYALVVAFVSVTVAIRRELPGL